MQNRERAPSLALLPPLERERAPSLALLPPLERERAPSLLPLARRRKDDELCDRLAL